MFSDQRFHSGVRSYFDWLYRNRISFNVFIGLITLLSLYLATGLKLRTNFSELLPDHLPSVQTFKKVGERLGGTGTLLIGIESPHYLANEKFADQLAKKLDPIVGTDLRYFEYRYVDVQKYVEEYGLHYLTLEKLQKLETDLKDEIEKHQDDAIGLGLDSEADTTNSKDPSVNQGQKSGQWLNELDPRLRMFLNYKDAYLSADDGKIMIMILRPMVSSLSVESSIQLVNKIQGYINELNPKSIDPSLEVNLVGNVKSAISEFDTIKHDIVDTAIQLTVLILAVLFLFFWSAREICLLCANLLFAVAWTFGLTYLKTGYLNTQTAFLGSLVVGTGINYGIIFLSRYLELRRGKTEIREAIVQGMAGTIIPTLIAALTTAISFGSLLVARNKGLSQFGFMGALGIVFCWLAAFSLLPLWLYQLELKFPAKERHHPLAKWLRRPTAWFADMIEDRKGAILTLVVLIGISALGFAGFQHLMENPLEYDFDNLRNKVAVSAGIEAIESRISKAFPSSMSPSVVLMDSLEQAKELCPEVMKISAELPPQKNVIKSCMSLYELLPLEFQNNAQRIETMKRIQALLNNRLLRFSDDWVNIQRFKDRLTLNPPNEAALPMQLTRRFADKNGNIGLIGFVNPDSTKPLNDGINLLNYTNSIENIPLPKTKTIVHGAGDSFILADLLRGIKIDAPKVAAISFTAVAVVAIFLAGGWFAGLMMTISLLIATWWMLCVQGVFDLKYNFFNFIALPLTFGIGVDYPINIFMRCQQEGFRDLRKILMTSGAAVFLASLTTIIGYYTLIGASNQALVSFAKLAIIGEFTCLISAIVVVPTILSLIGKFKK